MHQNMPEDATCRQVQALCPESADCRDSTAVHKLTQYSQQQGRPSYRGRESFRGGRPNHRGGPAARAWPLRDYMDTVLRLHVNNVAQTPTSPGKSVHCHRSRVSLLWETWTFLKSMQKKSRQSQKN